MLKVKRFGASIAALALLIGAAACSTVRPVGPASTKTPVVFIHGWIEGPGIWDTFVNSLDDQGYTRGDITNFAYDSTATGAASSAATVATALGKSVDEALTYARSNGNPTATKVDIVSHSFGSMITRHCIAVGPCQGKVNHWMSLAGADGGTGLGSIPGALGQGSGQDMALGSPEVLLLKSPASIQSVRSQGVKVRVQWTRNDGIIIPPENSQWPTPENPEPAANKDLSNVAGLGHLNIFSNAGVIAETVSFFKT